MSQTARIAKNSILLVTQQLFLNIISIFAVGYIARSIGKIDYGKFIFAFNFIALFAPFMNLGIAAITTREITENIDKVNSILGKLLVFRIIAFLVVYFILILAVNIMGYPVETKMLVSLAGLTLGISTVTNTCFSVFQAFEKVEYVALTMFIAGFILTILSVLFVWFNLGLFGVTIAYVLGQVSGILPVLFCLKKLKVVPKFSFDLTYYLLLLKRARNFFFPDISTTVGKKSGIVILSKFAGDLHVGLYGAAFNLAERVLVIPESICSSLFPILIKSYRNSLDELISVYKKFFKYFLILSLPIATVLSFISNRIIKLIYGAQFTSAGLLLILLSWWVFFSFLDYIQRYALAAIHKEKKDARTSYVSNMIYIIVAFILIGLYKSMGAVISITLASVLSFTLNYCNVSRQLKNNFLDYGQFGKILFGNVVLAIVLFFTREINIFIIILFLPAFYLVILSLLGLMKIKEMKYILGQILKR